MNSKYLCNINLSAGNTTDKTQPTSFIVNIEFWQMYKFMGEISDMKIVTD
jgi:hypothetical protein